MTLRTGIKKIFDNISHPFGIEVVRYFGARLDLKQILKVIRQEEICVLLDVGANTGQYAMSMLAEGYKGKIISFEPLKDAYEQLKKNQSKYANWQVFERSAIGDFTGSTTINISENSHSSSILPISDMHVKAAPSAKYVGQLETPIHTLDSIFGAVTTETDKVFLKIDTQGFEDKVLAGATQSIQNIKLLQLELSLVPLYEGGKTIEWMLPYLASLGFEPVFFFPGYIDRTTDQIQQLEALFIKKT